MLIAQISDLHLRAGRAPAYRRVDTAHYLEQAVACLNGLDPRPDLVVATGDLVDAGSEDEYETLRAILADMRLPLLLLPGNHDGRAGLRAVFADHAYLRQDPEFCHYVVEDHPIRLICLDTQVPGRTHGELCARRLAWLEDRLRERPRAPTMIFMHHPPFRTGIDHMDSLGLNAGAEQLAALVAANQQIERIACGHLHRPITRRWAGTVVMTAPSTAHQIALDLHQGTRAAFVMEPPGMLLHHWSEGGGLVTHLLPTGDYPGPFPFH